MTGRPRVVIIGAGIVGCAIADELGMRGWTDLTVVDQGPLFTTGGSTSHTPGLVFQTHVSKTMTEFAAYTVRKYGELHLDGRPGYHRVGGLEVATTAPRMLDLHRRRGWAASYGVDGEIVDPGRCAELWPLLDPDMVHGGYHVPGDGQADPLVCAEAQAARAAAKGARFLPGTRVVAVEQRAGRVTGVRVTVAETGDGGSSRTARAASTVIPADVVVCAAGCWGPQVGRMAGVTVPLQPMVHQYALSARLPSLGPLPILRHQEQGLFFRRHGDRVGVGSYAHRPMPVRPAEIAAGAASAARPFTEKDFVPAWHEAVALLPELGTGTYSGGVNGVSSFTPDGFPLVGEAAELEGFWLAEAVRVTHSAGVARALAEWLVDGFSSFDLHECELGRFEPVQLSPSYVEERGMAMFAEAYDIVHPLRPIKSPRPLRTSPFHERHRELGAVFLEGAGWEQPHWFEANAHLDRNAAGEAARDAWAARHWSPVAAAEARAARERVALFDMTPLTRIEVAGPGAVKYLQWISTNNVAKPPGSVTYTLLLDASGGIRSDLTVARLADDLFQIGANGSLDLEWLRRHAPDDVYIRDITSGTCCVGVWGPHARNLLAPITDMDVSADAFPYFAVRSGHVGEVPVRAMRISLVGELGWELYTTADLGLRLWDTLWAAGAPLGVAAAGRAAFTSLRLEKGYRRWGVDMTPEHTPYEAGLAFALRTDKEFVGRSALGAAPQRRLVPLLTSQVVMGAEPVRAGGEVIGHVTSAAYGHTIDRPIAYAWLATPYAVVDTEVEVDYFDRKVKAIVAAEPLYDPAREKIRR
ncbi:GcvT family protein [Sinosporangium siamense]|uniref:Sarcosine dehydrogenase n=1 Tax=Sinosporangium siamense TaxID=1367973 RepID=A0A919RCF5_9ACTN|nr:FAD-dependent oxidoreductase [Sinosporangium siamense]GII89924.1 sarcosine dehydrogenase [Sinosporangium siamense]